jgi:hypothetical protein
MDSNEHLTEDTSDLSILADVPPEGIVTIKKYTNKSWVLSPSHVGEALIVSDDTNPPKALREVCY